MLLELKLPNQLTDNWRQSSDDVQLRVTGEIFFLGGAAEVFAIRQENRLEMAMRRQSIRF